VIALRALVRRLVGTACDCDVQPLTFSHDAQADALRARAAFAHALHDDSLSVQQLGRSCGELQATLERYAADRWGWRSWWSGGGESDPGRGRCGDDGASSTQHHEGHTGDGERAPGQLPA
jgi:hypothetical protein